MHAEKPAFAERGRLSVVKPTYKSS
jgi:hypothetical protein